MKRSGYILGGLLAVLAVGIAYGGKAGEIDKQFRNAVGAYRVKLGDVLLDSQTQHRNRALGSAGLLVAGDSGFAEIGSNVFVSVEGEAVFLKDGAPKLFNADGTHDITAPVTTGSVEAVYLFSASSAGALKITKGAESTTVGAAPIPQTPSGEAPLGYIRIACANTSAGFDPPHTDIGATPATGVTVTIKNLTVNPSDFDLD